MKEYDDYAFIPQDKIDKMAKEYNFQLNKIKSLSLDKSVLTECHKLFRFSEWIITYIVNKANTNELINSFNSINKSLVEIKAKFMDIVGKELIFDSTQFTFHGNINNAIKELIYANIEIAKNLMNDYDRYKDIINNCLNLSQNLIFIN
jgi:hypothetical protein